MTQARLPDGRILNFPDGTDPAIIQQTVKRVLAQQPVAQQAAPQSAREIARQDLLDPNIVERASVLPLGRTAEGEVELALPQFAADLVSTAGIPGGILKGGEFTPEEAAEFALVTSPSTVRGAARTAARAPDQAIQDVVEAGRQFDVPVMTTDVLPPEGIVGGLARQAGERIPIAGTSGPRVAQQRARQAAVDRFVEEFPPVREADIIESLKRRKTDISTRAGNVIERTKTNLADAGEIDITDVNKKIDDLIADLSTEGRIQDATAVERLQAVKDSLNAGPQTFDILRDNRTAVREALEAVDPSARSQLTSRAKSQFQSVYDEITKALDRTVENTLGDNAFRQYKQADQVFFREAQKFRKSRLKNVLDKGDVTPEAVENIVFRGKKSEVKDLFNSLDTQGRANVRAALISRAAEKATRDDQINPTLFANELNKLRTTTGVFFRKGDADRLRGLHILLNATRRAQDAAAVTPTGQSLAALAGVGAGATAGVIPSLLGAGTAGAAARLYESRAVRNFLTDLGKSGRKQSAVDRVINKHMGAVTDAIRRLSPTMMEEEDG